MKKTAALFVPLVLVGCANLNSIYRTFNVSDGESPMVDIRQRAVLVAPDKKQTIKRNADGSIETTLSDRGVIVCAEPSPDAMASLAYELAAKGGVAEKASGELALAMQDSAAFTGIRTQSIQLLRDFGYRLCESYLSGAITADQYDVLMRRYQKNTVALLAIEQLTGTVRVPPVVIAANNRAEVTKSLSEQRIEREKVGDHIAALETEKSEAKKASDAAKAADKSVDTTLADKKIVDLEGKIKRLKDDQTAIDKAIESTRGMVAEGRFDISVGTELVGDQRSDSHVLAVANVVHDIVNNIVLSDDQDQLCMSALQRPVDDKSKDFRDWCIKNLNNQAEARAKYLVSITSNLDAERKKADKLPPNSQQRKDVEQKIESLTDELKGEAAGNKIYVVPLTE
jgi:hypothetical protein